MEAGAPYDIYRFRTHTEQIKDEMRNILKQNNINLENWGNLTKAIKNLLIKILRGNKIAPNTTKW